MIYPVFLAFFLALTWTDSTLPSEKPVDQASPTKRLPYTKDLIDDQTDDCFTAHA